MAELHDVALATGERNECNTFAGCIIRHLYFGLCSVTGLIFCTMFC